MSRLVSTIWKQTVSLLIPFLAVKFANITHMRQALLPENLPRRKSNNTEETSFRKIVMERNHTPPLPRELADDMSSPAAIHNLFTLRMSSPIH